MNPFGMRLIYISPGVFRMGSPVTERGRSPDETLHDVVITRGFYIGETEVTQGQYKAVMGRFYDCSPCMAECQDPRITVMKIGWPQAVEFCTKLSQLEARSYRLPTEAEWEYACRAGTTTRFWFGDAHNAWDDSREGSSLYSEFIGCGLLCDLFRRRKPNSWGLYNVHDAAAEWCSDWYAPYPDFRVIDPQGPAVQTGKKVWRGDLSLFRQGRSAARRNFEPIRMGSTWACNPGMRVVLQAFPGPYPGP